MKSLESSSKFPTDQLLDVNINGGQNSDAIFKACHPKAGKSRK